MGAIYFLVLEPLSFWGLLRIGEIALSEGNNAGQILAVDDVKLTLNKLVIHLRFSKTAPALYFFV
jgi:hypothetical protein